MDNVKTFISLYNELDTLLRNQYKDNNRSNSVMLRFEHDLTNSGVNLLIDYGKKLNMIRSLRNTLVHDLDMNEKNIITISEETISFLKELIDYIKHPRLAKDIMVPLKKILAIKKLDHKVIVVMNEMRERGFSQLPYFDENNILLGVFSPNVLFSYLNEHPSTKLDNLTIRELLDYLPISKHFSESYIFIPSYLKETEIADVFMNNLSHNKKSVLAFVTLTGKENEPVLGLIVTSDLLKD